MPIVAAVIVYVLALLLAFIPELRELFAEWDLTAGEEVSVGETQECADRKTISLALQGGGSHGAFAWGALDRILEDERIVIEGIVGTSAGAMNAVVTAYGLTLGGNEGARQSLRRLWEAVAERGTWSLMQPSWLDQLISPGSLDYSPGWIMMDTLSRVLSPYQMNPANYHPLRDILNEQIDFDTLCRSDKVKQLGCTYSTSATCRLTPWSLQVASLLSSRRSRSTASISGMAAIWGIRQSFPLSTTAPLPTYS